MRRILCLVAVFVGLVVFIGCQITRIDPKEGYRIVPKCEPLVKYDGHSFKLKALDIPIGSTTVKIGEVDWDHKTLASASEAAKTLDQYRLRRCDLLMAAASSLPDGDYNRLLLRQFEMLDALETLDGLIRSGNKDAVAAWTKSYDTKVQTIEGAEKAMLATSSGLTFNVTPGGDGLMTALKSNRRDTFLALAPLYESFSFKYEETLN